MYRENKKERNGGGIAYHSHYTKFVMKLKCAFSKFFLGLKKEEIIRFLIKL